MEAADAAASVPRAELNKSRRWHVIAADFRSWSEMSARVHLVRSSFADWGHPLINHSFHLKRRAMGAERLDVLPGIGRFVSTLLLQSDVRNRLLAGLRPSDYAVLQPSLERRLFDRGFAMERPDRVVTHVYFPEPGVVSLVARTPSGLRLESGIVGPEGMTGLALLHGADRSPNEAFVQMAGRVIFLEAAVMVRALRQHRTIHDHLLLYEQAFSIQVSQTALANGLFTLGERLARWLLMCHDRADRENLVITHESLSLMLGVRRAGVTTALQVLERAGALDGRRGVVVVRSRAVLLAAAGESYGVAEAEYDRLMGAAQEA